LKHLSERIGRIWKLKLTLSGRLSLLFLLKQELTATNIATTASRTVISLSFMKCNERKSYEKCVITIVELYLFINNSFEVITLRINQRWSFAIHCNSLARKNWHSCCAFVGCNIYRQLHIQVAKCDFIFISCPVLHFKFQSFHCS